MRTLVAAICCLAIGLIGGFYAGRASRPVAGVSVQPVPPPAVVQQPDTGTRARTNPSAPELPSQPVQVTPEPGNVASVQPPPVHERGRISLPLDNVKLSDIQDTFDQGRGGGVRRHEATDIMAPRGTPVRAVEDGTIRRLFLSKDGGNTIYQFDPTETYVYYYAHLDRYADGIYEGMQVKRGQLIGYVGSTGDANPSAPHLHFAVFLLGPGKEWWKGSPINPYSMLVESWKRTHR